VGRTSRYAAGAWARIAAHFGGGLRAGALGIATSQDLDASAAALSSEAPQEAMELWRAFVAGEWSLIDHFDSDGYRYLVAWKKRATKPGVTGGLTLSEQQVLAYRASGHALKLAAYELGFSQATASRHLVSGMRKLGIRSQVDLARVLGAGAAAIDVR
jgi:DNA-binding NarL/FixJ family response regulator